jgi:hypothetical protein
MKRIIILNDEPQNYDLLDLSLIEETFYACFTNLKHSPYYKKIERLLSGKTFISTLSDDKVSFDLKRLKKLINKPALLYFRLKKDLAFYEKQSQKSI